MTDTAHGQLRAFIEHIERLQEERKTIADDIAEVFKELEDAGFDKPAAKAILKIRQADDGLAVWTERSAIVDLYLSALGMLPAPAPARARENIEEFPANEGSRADHKVDANSAVIGGDIEASGWAVHQDHIERPDVLLGGVPGGTDGAEGFEPPTFLTRRTEPLRPHCLNPDICAGIGRSHCYTCKKAMGEQAA